MQGEGTTWLPADRMRLRRDRVQGRPGCLAAASVISGTNVRKSASARFSRPCETLPLSLPNPGLRPSDCVLRTASWATFRSPLRGGWIIRVHTPSLEAPEVRLSMLSPEKGLIASKTSQKRTSGAKARCILNRLWPDLKSCPDTKHEFFPQPVNPSSSS